MLIVAFWIASIFACKNWRVICVILYKCKMKVFLDGKLVKNPSKKQRQIYKEQRETHEEKCFESLSLSSESLILHKNPPTSPKLLLSNKHDSKEQKADHKATSKTNLKRKCPSKKRIILNGKVIRNPGKQERILYKQQKRLQKELEERNNLAISVTPNDVADKDVKSLKQESVAPNTQSNSTSDRPSNPHQMWQKENSQPLEKINLKNASPLSPLAQTAIPSTSLVEIITPEMASHMCQKPFHVPSFLNGTSKSIKIMKISETPSASHISKDKYFQISPKDSSENAEYKPSKHRLPIATIDSSKRLCKIAVSKTPKLS